VTIAPDAIIIGTSAGAVVGAQVASGIAMAELYERQFHGVPHEDAVGLKLSGALRLAGASLFARSPEDGARRIGALALAAQAEAGLLTRIATRLPVHEWSARDLRVVAVDTESGESRVFTRADGVPLVDAVAASCAVPISTAPITIEGRRYMDGGMRSTLNLDLAPGDGPVIALAPSTASIGPWARISKQRAALGADRAIEILQPDATSKRIRGTDVMNRSVVPALVAAAREQGRREADRVRSLA
jgi:NTE family protein